MWVSFGSILSDGLSIESPYGWTATGQNEIWFMQRSAVCCIKAMTWCNSEFNSIARHPDHLIQPILPPTLVNLKRRISINQKLLEIRLESNHISCIHPNHIIPPANIPGTTFPLQAPA